MFERLLHARPPVLPPWLDGLSERWASAGTWTRTAIIAGIVVAGLAVAGRGAATSPWGPEVDVVVAARELPAGRVLEAGDLTTARWPHRLVPPGSPAAVGEAAGRTLAVGAPQGTLVTGDHLAEDGIASRLGQGRVAYPLPVPDGAALAAGQIVDLVTGDGDGGGVRLAAGARILAVDGTTAWVAVAREEAPAVAGAASWGEVVAVILSSGGAEARR